MMGIKRKLITLLLISICFLGVNSWASNPLWRFTPLTQTTVNVPANDTRTIQYSVTNQSGRQRTLSFRAIPGVTQTTGFGNCANPFVLNNNESCRLTLQVNGSQLTSDIHSGPIVCQGSGFLQCYQPSFTNRLNITQGPAANAVLSPSVETLALAVNGNNRLITITNTGDATAQNVTYSTFPALPAGTTISPANCGNIAPGGNCVLTVSPGGTASATPGDVNPTPIALVVQGANSTAASSAISVLTNGSVYQSGYLFSIDDSTANTQSIGGTVAALANQAAPFPNGIAWSTDANGDPATDNIAGINENPNPPPCVGSCDGSQNTNLIVTFYSPPNTDPGVPFSFYAAGLCQATIDGFNDWYLPAICEMGFDMSNNGSGCGVPPNPPTIDNMQTNLVANGFGNLSGAYWSSTQDSLNAANDAWTQVFGMASNQLNDDNKGTTLNGVRCVRALTN